MLNSNSYSNRRQFLKNAGKTGSALALAAALNSPAAFAHASEPVQTSIFDNPDLRGFLRDGTAPLWVAGQTLNSFAYYLQWRTLPPLLKWYFHRAGGQWKNTAQAKAVWETIPPQIRAGGHRELVRFLRKVDWSHIIPKSQGGKSTVDNAIFELKILNRIRGGAIMTDSELAAARAFLRSEAIAATVRLTLGAMVTGAVAGIVVGGLITCLECGLQYAEGKITWNQMVNKIVQTGVMAGGFSFIITGVIVGLALIAPALLGVLVPVFTVLQIVMLVFLAGYAINLGERYWKVFREHDFIEDAAEILDETEQFMRDTVKETRSGVSAQTREWTRGIARWMGWKRAREFVASFYETMGIDRAWTWIASQTRVVKGYAADLVSPLRGWGFSSGLDVQLPEISLPQLHMPEVNIDMYEMKEAIAGIISVDFEPAIQTAGELKSSLNNYIESAEAR